MNTSNPSCNENGYVDLVSKNIVTETIVALLPPDATTCAISLLAVCWNCLPLSQPFQLFTAEADMWNPF
jgi:hypothetical protein